MAVKNFDVLTSAKNIMMLKGCFNFYILIFLEFAVCNL
jgi:hypothetical protein